MLREKDAGIKHNLVITIFFSSTDSACVTVMKSQPHSYIHHRTFTNPPLRCNLPLLSYICWVGFSFTRNPGFTHLTFPSFMATQSLAIEVRLWRLFLVKEKYSADQAAQDAVCNNPGRAIIFSSNKGLANFFYKPH